jgi:hypothetical protein
MSEKGGFVTDPTALGATNEGAVLARADVLIGRLGEERRRNRANRPLIHLLDAGDLAALRHTAGIFLGLLALGAEAEAAPEVEDELRAALVALIPLMQAVSDHLEESPEPPATEEP